MKPKWSIYDLMTEDSDALPWYYDREAIVRRIVDILMDMGCEYDLSIGVEDDSELQVGICNDWFLFVVYECARYSSKHGDPQAIRESTPANVCQVLEEAEKRLRKEMDRNGHLPIHNAERNSRR